MSDTKHILIGVCVPTVRPESAPEFFQEWSHFFLSTGEHRYRVLVFLHEDLPEKTVKIPPEIQERIRHTCHSDIESELGKAHWIIPRNSGACRSFPILLAWREGCEFIVTLDDDCYPVDGGGKQFIDSHLDAFQLDRWFRTIDGEYPRGIPFERRGSLPVKVNHGLWGDVPDLDSPTSLVRLREPCTYSLRRRREVVPPGMAFPLSAMNVCYHRSIVPAAYNLLMGLETYGIDRFDDIWSGLLVKRIADHLGWYVTSGLPIVRHARASNSFLNMRKEALGIHIHEMLWDYILDSPLPADVGVIECYEHLAARLAAFPGSLQSVPAPPQYFQKLGEAMLIWASLFKEG